MNGHVVILASAGTGKTHRLTGRLLSLVLRGVEPERILASTFTRAAAAEILARALQRLNRASRAQARAAALARELSLDRLTPDDCVAALQRILAAAASLRVGTIDSLCIRLAGAATLDLNLLPGWRILGEAEAESLRLDAARRTLAASAPSGLDTLLGLLRESRSGTGVIAEIDAAAREAHAIWVDAPREAWTSAWSPDTLPPLDDPALAAALDALAALPLPLTRQGKPNQNWSNAIDNARRAAADDDWERFLTKGVPEKILSGESTYSRAEITPAIRAVFAPLVEHASAVLLDRHRRRTRAIEALLARFDEAYRAEQRARGAYTFDDITRLLAAHAQSEPAFVQRLDARVDHVLLDEFQDTSVDQFRLLEPLLDEIVSGESGSVLCVGDAKQSLYTWRRAEPALLASLRERWPHVADERLDANFRSSRVVLDAVDRVFLDLPSLLSGADAPVLDAASSFSGEYRAHIPARDLPGRVALIEAPDDRASALTLAVERVAALHAQAPACSIGVLVRSRKVVTPLIQGIRSRGIEATEDTGNPLTDSPAVSTALALLHLAEHPADRAAAFHVATSPLGRALALTDWRDADRIDAVTTGLRREIARHGLDTVLASWLRAIAADADERDLRRFERLLALTGEVPMRRGFNLAEFIRHVRTTRVEDTHRAAVRVMTIHSSKGLEFDAVILPELWGPLVGRTPTLVAHRSHPAAPVEAVCAYPNELLARLDPAGLGAIRDAHIRRAARETLCVLYVAMTRARRVLELIVPADAEKKFSAADLLRRALAEPAPAEDRAPGDLWSRVEGDWTTGLDPASAPAPEPFRVSLTRRAAPPSPQAVEHAPARRLAADVPAREGEVLHAWFERLTWIDDPRPDPAEMRGVLRAVAPDLEPGFDTLARIFTDILEIDAVRALLSRPADARRRTLHRERTLAYRRNGEIVVGRVDRLVIEGEPPDTAHIIDFKSDRGASPDSLVLAHARQMHAYADAVASTFALSRDRLRATLVGVRTGVVADVPLAGPPPGL